MQWRIICYSKTPPHYMQSYIILGNWNKHTIEKIINSPLGDCQGEYDLSLYQIKEFKNHFGDQLEHLVPSKYFYSLEGKPIE